MKKSYLILVAAAAIFAACSSDKLANENQVVQQQAEPGVVAFDAYTQRGVTRAGQTDIMTTEKLKAPKNLTNQNGGGFGVFAYYTDNNDYEQSRVPDYMYNQLVEWDEANNYWKYEPIKYWPNEYGSTAISDDADKVTFFAYAPYVATNASGKIERSTGDDLTSYGITGLSRNSNQGDPIVKYIASFERAKSVDLLWGVVGHAEASSWKLTNGGTQTTIEEGYPWLNVMRPAEAATQKVSQQRVKFTFAHALTQLSMNIDAIVDEITKGSNELDASTKIYVRQLSMTGVALKGALNLNNSESGKQKALWLDYNGLADIESGVPVVLYDGRKDGKEGVSGATASNEKIIGFNPDIISNDGNSSPGVTETPKKVFNDDPVMLIPTGENMELEIIYDVETADAKLPTLLSDGKTNGSSIENKIRKTIDFTVNNIPYGLENGKHYTINLHLGMNSVKFDVAAVEPWNNDVNQPNVDLPSNSGGNVGSVANVASAPINNFDSFTGLTHEPQLYSFTVSGLTPGEDVEGYVASATYIDAIRPTSSTTATVKISSTNDFSGSGDNKANNSGVTYVQVNLPGNSYVHNLATTDNYILIEGKTSLKGWKARFEQAAHPFGLEVESVENETLSGPGDIITLKASPGVDANALTLGALTNTDKSYGALTGKESEFVKLSVNNNPCTYSTEYTYADKKITTKFHLAAGDKVSITVAAYDGSVEDGAKETVEFIVGGIAYASGQTLTYKTTPQDPKEPTSKFGIGEPTLTYSEVGTSDLFDIIANKITTLKYGTATNIVQCVAAYSSDPNKEYFYTTTSCTATYDLTINKQATTVTYSPKTAIKTDVNTVSDVVVGTYTVTSAVSNDENTDLSGSVKYSITKVTIGSDEYTAAADIAKLFAVGESTGQLTVGTDGLSEAKNYFVVIKGAYEANNQYEASEDTITVSVQTVGF